ncbi:MAG TPA: extracellular solute-binding protein [Rugosimonospora sp.]|nr:extracellular solute-binding protein [Rugosimonospora sp.]
MATFPSGGGLSRRRLLQLTGGAATAGALAACGSNTGRSSGSSSGKVALSQWYHLYGETGTQQAAMRYAKEYTKADVTVQWTPGDYDSKISSGLLANSGPDVFEWHFNYQLAKSGQVVPLDDIIADAKSDFSQVDLAANSLDGKVYGIRMIDDPQLFFYRKSMFDKAKLQPPTTVDELLECAKALTTKDVKGLFLGNDNGVDWANGQLIAMSGQTYLTADNKVAFDTTATTDALLKLRALANSKTLLSGAPQDWWDPSAFNQGLCAINRQGLWALPAMLKAFPDDVGAFANPAAGPTGKQAIYVGGWTTFVNAKSKNVDAAKQFVKWLWLDNKADELDWALSYGFHIPPRQSLDAQATKLQSGVAADVVAMSKQYGWGDNPAWTQAMGAAFTDMCSSVILKNGDPKAALATCVGKVKTELQKLFG